MRLAWAIVLGLGVGIGLAVWAARDDTARRDDPRRQRTPAAQAREAAPALYRWRDAQGVLQITEQPPKGRAYERIGREAERAIAVDGNRD